MRVTIPERKPGCFLGTSASPPPWRLTRQLTCVECYSRHESENSWMETGVFSGDFSLHSTLETNKRASLSWMLQQTWEWEKPSWSERAELKQSQTMWLILHHHHTAFQKLQNLLPVKYTQELQCTTLILSTICLYHFPLLKPILSGHLWQKSPNTVSFNLLSALVYISRTH